MRLGSRGTPAQRPSGEPRSGAVVLPEAEIDGSEIDDRLRAGWLADLESGRVDYDPATATVVEHRRFRYHFLPGRLSRPGSWNSPVVPREGLFCPHAACPFDDDGFVAERELLRLERGGRVTHLVSNRFPVTPRHFLGVRAGDAAPEHLPQYIQGAAEIEDLVLFARALGPGFRIYFNSNRGADGSHSGSSVNHWHFQCFPYSYRTVVDELPTQTLSSDGALRLGRVEDWPARHVFVEGPRDDPFGAAAAAWRQVDRLNTRNVAYNLEVRLLPSGRLRAYVFGRRPAAPVELEAIGPLPQGFGGWELTGDFVIPRREQIDWIAACPDEADRITAERLRATTCVP